MTATTSKFQIQAIPADLLARVRLRHTDVSGNPIEPVQAEGGEPLRLLADPEILQVHSRNVAYGCFMFVVTRAR